MGGRRNAAAGPLPRNGRDYVMTIDYVLGRRRNDQEVGRIRFRSAAFRNGRRRRRLGGQDESRRYRWQRHRQPQRVEHELSKTQSWSCHAGILGLGQEQQQQH